MSRKQYQTQPPVNARIRIKKMFKLRTLRRKVATLKSSCIKTIPITSIDDVGRMYETLPKFLFAEVIEDIMFDGNSSLADIFYEFYTNCGYRFDDLDWNDLTLFDCIALKYLILEMLEPCEKMEVYLYGYNFPDQGKPRYCRECLYFLLYSTNAVEAENHNDYLFMSDGIRMDAYDIQMIICSCDVNWCYRCKLMPLFIMKRPLNKDFDYT